MRRDEAIIEEVNALWTPVYPFLAAYLLDSAGIHCGHALDLGPFAGGIALAVLDRERGFRATVLDESPRLLRWVRTRAEAGGVASRLTTRAAGLDPIPEPDESFDLVAVRGAFFFLTPSLLREVRRVLKPGGLAWVGGGYGPGTPERVIASIADRSRLLNEALGKRRISPQEAQDLLAASGLSGSARVSTQGGLWIEVRA